MSPIHSRRGLTLIETLIGVGATLLLAGVLLPAVRKVRAASDTAACRNNLSRIGTAALGYYDNHGGRFFRSHPFDADVRGNTDKIAELPTLHWVDQLTPYLGDSTKSESDAVGQDAAEVNRVFRCPADRSAADPATAAERRTSYLLNAAMSHRTRRYRGWTLDRWKDEVGLSQVIAFAEGTPAATDPDDFRVWLGTDVVCPQIAADRHASAANYLYLDGHVALQRWEDAVTDLFPDRKVLTEDGSFP